MTEAPKLQQFYDVPFDEEMERAVIGGTLVDARLYHDISQFLQPGHFFLVRHRVIWEAIGRMSKASKPVDMLTITDELRGMGKLNDIGGEGYIAKIMAERWTALHTEAYAQLVLRDARRRAGIEAADKVRAIFQNKELSLEDALAQSEAEMAKATGQIASSRLLNTKQVADLFIARAMQEDPATLPTGFGRLDEMTGGLRRGHLSIFAGTSGLGKSTALLNIGMNVASMKRTDGRRNRVLWFPIEMSAIETLDRIIARAESIAISQVEKTKMHHDHMDGVGEFLLGFEDLEIEFDESPRITPAHVRSTALAQKPDLIIIDYIQLMKPEYTVRGGNKHQALTHISEELKAIAKELDCVILTASQLSRWGIRDSRENNRAASLESLKESGSLENDAALAVMLHQTDEMADNDLVELSVQKNRFGAKWYDRPWKGQPPMLKMDRKHARMTCAGVVNRTEA